MGKYNIFLRNRSGFTLTETIIGLGLLAIVTLGTTTFMVSSVKTTMNTTNEVVQRIDKTNAEIQIIKDLKQVFPSYSFLVQKDDANKNFYDIMPSESNSIITAKVTTSFRKKTLSAVGDEIIFAEYDLKRGVGVPYDPVWAYEFGPISKTDPNLASTFAFKGLDSGASKILSSKMLEAPIKGDMFLIDSPAPFKTLSGFTIDVSKPLKFTHYLFYIKDLTNPVDFSTAVETTSFTPSLPLGAIKNIHPITGATIPNADKYLQNLPSVSGTIPTLVVRPIKFVKYVLQLNVRKEVALFRQDLKYSGGTSFSFATPGREVIDKIVEVKFERFIPQSTQIKVSINQKKEGT